jgi:hypothetical protein
MAWKRGEKVQKIVRGNKARQPDPFDAPVALRVVLGRALRQIVAAGCGIIGGYLKGKGGVGGGERLAIGPGDVVSQRERNLHLVHLQRLAIKLDGALFRTAACWMDEHPLCQAYNFSCSVDHYAARSHAHDAHGGISIVKAGQLLENHRVVDVVSIVDRTVVERLHNVLRGLYL